MGEVYLLENEAWETEGQIKIGGRHLSTTYGWESVVGNGQGQVTDGRHRQKRANGKLMGGDHTRRTILSMRVRTAFLAGLLLPTLSLGAWTVTDLHPTGPFESFGQGVSGGGQVGWVNYGDTHAAFWSGSAASFVDLHPAVASDSRAHAADGAIQAGYVVIGTQPHASIWSGTAASWIDLNPPGLNPSVVFGINGGTQVGYVSVSNKRNAAKWTGSAASIVNLHPAGATQSAANGVYGGTQVGYAGIGGSNHASKWTGTAGSWVDLHPAGATSSSATCAANGKIGGQATFAGDSHAGFWTGTAASWVDLHPAGADSSSVAGITPTRQVGHFVPTGGNNKAAYWSGTAASMVDLHALLPGTWNYSYARAIYESGGTVYIVGYAHNGTSNNEHAVIWTQTSSADDFEFTLNKTQVAGQNSVQGTISVPLASPSPRVYTTYDNSSLVNTPPSVTLLANTTVKNFQITVTAVTATINTTVYAKYGSLTRSRPLALIPLVPTALAFTPTQVTGGQTVSCRVVINGVAGPGGRVIAILDNSPNATVPATVTVPAGATQVIFNITTTAVTSQKTVTVTARVSAGEKTGTFKINP